MLRYSVFVHMYSDLQYQARVHVLSKVADDFQGWSARMLSRALFISNDLHCAMYDRSILFAHPLSYQRWQMIATILATARDP
jgi:hypothetical protein